MNKFNTIALNQSAHCGNVISHDILGQKFLKDYKSSEGEDFCEDLLS